MPPRLLLADVKKSNKPERTSPDGSEPKPKASGKAKAKVKAKAKPEATSVKGD